MLVLFLSGVLQGCPGSAMMFNNALDPFPARFHNALRAEKSGIIRACADDIGITFTMLKHLRLVHPIFEDCKTHAGLNLKPIKCVLVPLCNWSEAVQKCIVRWLKKNIPEWTNFKVAPYAKLLGFYLGPSAGSKMWEGPFKKYENRILAIKNGQASLALNAFTYNTRVVPVTSYVAQLVPLPKFQERFGMLSVLRCPNCMRHSDLFELSEIWRRGFL